MDYAGIIRRAWHITWRNKTLWVLGLFAGATGGGYGWGSSGFRSSGQNASRLGSTTTAWSQFVSFLQQWWPAILAASLAFVLIGLLWLVLSVAAQAGLVREVDNAERNRPVSANEGWDVGFHNWWKVLGLGAVLFLPLLVFALLVFSLLALALVPVLASGSGGSTAGWAGIAGAGLVFFASIPIYIVLAFVLGTMYFLAIRHVVLDATPVMRAIGLGWQHLRHRFKDVFLMWLVTLGLSIAFAIAIAIPAGIIAAIIGLTAAVGAWPVTALFGLALFALTLALTAGWNTFTSAMWTIFFRRLTGREVLARPSAWSAPPALPYPPTPGAYGPYPVAEHGDASPPPAPEP